MMKLLGALMILAFSSQAVLARDHGRGRGGRDGRWDDRRGHDHDHHRRDRDDDNDDAEAIAAGAGILLLLLSTSTVADANNDYNRAILEDVATSIVSGEDSALLTYVMNEMEGDNADLKKAILLKKIEKTLSQK